MLVGYHGINNIGAPLTWYLCVGLRPRILEIPMFGGDKESGFEAKSGTLKADQQRALLDQRSKDPELG